MLYNYIYVDIVYYFYFVSAEQTLRSCMLSNIHYGIGTAYWHLAFISAVQLILKKMVCLIHTMIFMCLQGLPKSLLCRLCLICIVCTTVRHGEKCSTVV